MPTLRRKLLWGLITLLAALTIISGGYRAFMLHMDRELKRMSAEGHRDYQRLMQTVPAHAESQP